MTSLVQTRIDNDVKIKAEQVLKAMGMSLNDGIRIFLNQVIMEKAMPFKPVVINEPNEETIAAVKRCDSKEGLRKVSFKEFKKMLEN